MNQISYSIKHQYQPTSTTCSPTSLSMLLDYYGIQKSIEDISREVPQVQNEKGESFGTINQQLATYCRRLGFDVAMYTFDCQIIDQAWAGLSKAVLLERLEARKSGWAVPALGSLWNEAYVQSYIDFLHAGGTLQISPAPTSDLIYGLLENGPIFACVSMSTMYGHGRIRIINEHSEILDDVNGRALNHSIVISGYDTNGNLQIIDPFIEPGQHTVPMEQTIAAIATAQIECDNLLFQLSRGDDR